MKGYSIILIIVVTGTISCTPRPEPIELDSANLLVQADLSTKLTDTQFRNSSSALGKMVMYEFYQTVSANGMFDVPPENITTISTFFGGYVKELKLMPGERVEKGELLMILENPEYIQMQQDYLEAKGQLSYLRNDFERQKILIRDSVTSQKKYFKAEADFNVMLARYESLKRQLKLINIDTEKLKDNNITSTIQILSPMTGYVTEINVTKGMYLTPAFEALTITNTSHLHLELNIFEKDLPFVKVGQLIKFRTQDNLRDFMATVFLVNKSIDAQSRTISVHGDLIDEQESRLFVPGMYVEAQILTITKKALALPKEAVVNIDEKYFVLVKVESESGTYNFQKREVKPDMTVNGYVEIVNYDEFASNSDFLIKGAFNLIKD